MGRERQDFFRESNTIEKEKIFILAFEGNVTESIYFTDFRNTVRFKEDLIYLHLLTRPKSDTNSAPNHVLKKLKTEARDEFNFNKNDELWMIIDTDNWDIAKIAAKCKQEGVFLAVSNPCFEFWLLLHLKDSTEYSFEEQQQILANKKVKPGKKNYIEHKLIEILGTYNKSKLKSALFLPTLNDAILRAKKLDNAKEDFPRQLGSHIYKLMDKLL
ncbi:hypothetical protein CMV00_01885 [Elizabethkingia anophelis]|nr:hypothetical protein [Elizabethkingia anophelis]